MMTKLLNAEELSQMLRVPKRTIYKFAQEGQVPGTIKIGKHWRFNESVIKAWILEQTKLERVTVKK